MKPIPADHTFTMKLRVTPEMTARFFDCEIHPLYATFTIVEHAEYAARCAILPYVEPHEDAVGSAVTIDHTGPAVPGDLVTITATIVEQEGRSIVCSFTVLNGEQQIATGTTTQRVISKEKLNARVTALRS